MGDTRITVNGQHYDSPEAMPPDVRRTYEEAMRALGQALPGGPAGASTQVFTGGVGPGLGASVVVNRTITVNNRAYKSVDELPPEVRQQLEGALEDGAAQVHPKASVHVSFKMGGSNPRALDEAGKPSPSDMVPIDSSTESRIRDIPVTLAILIVVGLILWAFLGRQ